MLVAWVEDGAKEGDPSNTGGEPPPTVGLERVDLSLSLPLPYEVNTEKQTTTLLSRAMASGGKHLCYGVCGQPGTRRFGPPPHRVHRAG